MFKQAKQESKLEEMYKEIFKLKNELKNIKDIKEKEVKQKSKEFKEY